jgi:peptide/nickel transport system permease protein
VAEIRAQLGLDQPLWYRLGEFVLGLVQGDLGTSPITGQRVIDALLQRLPVSSSES